MAKKEVKKERGGGSIEQQIAKLKKDVGAKGVAQAEEWVDTVNHDIIRLAFKLVPKTSSASSLSKREQKTFDEIKGAAGDEAAESWKTARLKAKAAAKKG